MLDLGYVECRMDLHNSVKHKTNSHRVHHLRDGKWTYETWCQLFAVHPERKILGGEPYPLTLLINQSRESMSIGKVSIGGGGLA